MPPPPTLAEISPHLAALAASQGGPFTTAQAIDAGYDDREIYRQLRSGRWTHLRRGAYAERSAVPNDNAGRHVLQVRAALLTLKRPAVVSHVSAATLHEVALLDPDFSLVHITRDGWGSSRVEGGIRHHDATLPDEHVTKIGEVIATSAARTVLDLARSSDFASGLVVAESALRLGLTSRLALREVLECCVDWPGARRAGRVVSFASSYSESPGESLSRVGFEALRLPMPLQQVEVYDAFGFIARLDFLWEDHFTAGEFDGRTKYLGVDTNTLYEEKKREDRLRDAGIEVIRFGWADVRVPSPIIRRKALEAFARAAQRTSRPSLRFQQPAPR